MSDIKQLKCILNYYEYDIKNEIAIGGFGIVYKGNKLYDKKKKVAIKQILLKNKTEKE